MIYLKDITTDRILKTSDNLNLKVGDKISVLSDFQEYYEVIEDQNEDVDYISFEKSFVTLL